MVARHQSEMRSSGHVVTGIKKWGALAAALTAIFALLATFGTQVWPWCVSAGLGDRDEILRKNTEAVAQIAELRSLLEATIDAAGERVHAADLRAERLYGSIEALRNEVRLRHGVADSGPGMSARSHRASRGGRATPAARPRPMSRQQQIRVIAKQADEKLQASKKAAPKKKAVFRDQIKAKL
jgi:hypothetical protein